MCNQYRTIPLILFTSFITLIVSGQNTTENYYKKGNFFAYWGWNRSSYTTSDIHFKGNTYDFTLSNVVAKDRQSPFSVKTYFYPSSLTIPQYNFRFGYFFHDKYTISFGADHMKYVMQQDQTVKIDGSIAKSGTSYDGTYNDNDIVLTDDFLMLEHTDGLNYENIEVRRFDVIYNRKNFSISLNEGLGAGVLVPRTDITLMGNPRNNEFHLAGFGIAGVGALNLTFFKYFFIQTECKAGYINMPDIRTTPDKSDKADQQFWFVQYNLVFGGNFRLNFKKEKKTN